MQNEIFEQFTQASKASYETFQQLGNINSKALQKLTELQFSVATLGIESSVEQAKLLSSTNNYKDLVSAESELASDYGNKLVDLTKQTAAVLNESGEEVMAWFEKSAETLTDTAKTTAKKTTAAAKKAA